MKKRKSISNRGTLLIREQSKIAQEQLAEYIEVHHNIYQI